MTKKVHPTINKQLPPKCSSTQFPPSVLSLESTAIPQPPTPLMARPSRTSEMPIYSKGLIGPHGIYCHLKGGSWRHWYRVDIWLSVGKYCENVPIFFPSPGEELCWVDGRVMAARMRVWGCRVSVTVGRMQVGGWAAEEVVWLSLKQVLWATPFYTSLTLGMDMFSIWP
jgi:hypothetical protein